MVFKGSLYILNLLCGIIPCDIKYPFPDTSTTEPQAFSNQVNVDYDGDQLELNAVAWKDGGNNDLYRDIDYNKTHPLVVYTSTGKMRGFWMKAVGGRKVRAFEGIPYAEMPFRFQAPKSKVPWKGLLQATLKGPKCLQYNQIALSRVVGSENCLYLNIYTPKPITNKNLTRKFPVLIYIHGGGYLTGSGNDFGPAYLLQRNLILVTFNYRLGVMGFMSTMDGVSPGNYGLKDQAEAINWVYKNILHFNGDPTKITLLGHGSGASSVHFQMMSFRARGSFHAAISISGTAFNQWAMHTRDQALNLTKRFAKSLHCPIHGKIQDTVDCLQKQRGHDLVKMQISFLDQWPLELSLFRPVVEDEYHKDDPFLTETPEEAYQRGTVDKVPWICGQAEDEGYTFLLSHVALGTFVTLRQQWNKLAADFLNYNDLPVDQDEITRRVNWLYFRHINPATAPLKIYSDALGSRLIHTGIHKSLQAHSQHAETYAFMFGYNGKYNLATAAGIKPKEWAVGHGEILGYILNSTNMYAGFQKDDSELVLSKILVNLIYNFAETRKPGFTTENGEIFHVWNPITDPRNMSFLHIDKKIKMIPEPYLQQILYWESFGLPDSLPLGNFTDEIQNVTTDENSKGFVSTDITRTGSSVPQELRPPLPQLDNNSYALYNVGGINAPEVGNHTLETRMYPEVTTTTTTLVPPPPLANFTITSTATSITSSAPTPTRWLAQDQLPRVPTSPLPTEQLKVDSNNSTGVSENIFSKVFEVIQNHNNIIPISNRTKGISIPILSGKSNIKFITRSNITREYLSSIGLARRIMDQDHSPSTDPDETMMTASNFQYSMYK